jgi:5-formyltetrahydrofolate cyclo-ligase
VRSWTGKSELRRRAQHARGALGTEHRTEASAAICARLLTLPEVTAARTVAGYASTGAEVDVDPALHHLLEADCTVALPWVEGDGVHMAAIADLRGDLVPGWRGVREPRPALRSPIPPEDLDLAIVPGVAFDRAGTRLGYGGGHFDRFLVRLRPGTPIVGTAFDAQVLDRLPSEPHDVAVHVLVTESGVLRMA